MKRFLFAVFVVSSFSNPSFAAAPKSCVTTLESLSLEGIVTKMKTPGFWGLDFEGLLRELNPLGVTTEKASSSAGDEIVDKSVVSVSHAKGDLEIFKLTDAAELEALYRDLGRFFLQTDEQIDAVFRTLPSIARAKLSGPRAEMFSGIRGGASRFRILQTFIIQKILPLGHGNSEVASKMRLAEIPQPPPYLRALTAPDRLLTRSLIARLRHLPTTLLKIPFVRLQLWAKAGGRGDVIPTELLADAQGFFVHGRQIMVHGVPADLQWGDLPNEYKDIALKWMNAKEKMDGDNNSGTKPKPEGGWTKEFIELAFYEGLETRGITDTANLSRTEANRIMEESLGDRNYAIFRKGLKLAGEAWRDALAAQRKKFVNAAFVDPDKAAVKVEVIRASRTQSVQRIGEASQAWALSPEDRARLKGLEAQKLGAAWKAEEHSAMRAFATAVMKGRLYARNMGADLSPQIIEKFRSDPRYTYYALLDRLEAEKKMTPEVKEQRRKEFLASLQPHVLANLHVFPDAVKIGKTYDATNIKGKSDKFLAWVKSLSAFSLGVAGLWTVNQSVAKLNHHTPVTESKVYKVATTGLNPADPFGDPDYQKFKKEFLDSARMNGLDVDSAAFLRDFLRFVNLTNLAPEIRDQFEKLEHLKNHDPKDPLSKDFDDFYGSEWNIGAYERGWSFSGWRFHGPFPTQWERPFKLSSTQVALRSARIEEVLRALRLMNTISLSASKKRDATDRFILAAEVDIAADAVNARRAQRFGASKPAVPRPNTNGGSPATLPPATNKPTAEKP